MSDRQDQPPETPSSREGERLGTPSAEGHASAGAAQATARPLARWYGRGALSLRPDILEQISDDHLHLCYDWLRTKLREDIGPDAPQKDADLVALARARGYHCHQATRELDRVIELGISRHGKCIAAVEFPSVWVYQSAQARLREGK